MSKDFGVSTQALVRMVLQYLAVLTLLKFSSGFEYANLMSMEASCFPKDTCNNRGKGPRLDDPYDWKSRNCFCDDLCAEFGDCCLDAHAYVPQDQITNINNYECVDLKQFGTLYMKGKCMSEWEDQYIANMCTNSSLERIDPLAGMPVTSLTSSVTYINYYCAICNNDSVSLEVWQSRLECLTLKDYQDKYKNLTTEHVANNLMYNQSEKNWGLHVKDKKGEKFHTCYVYPSMPETVIASVRQCKLMINSCSSNWTDDAVRDLCHSYTAVRYNFDQAYRNIHCALCNDLSLNITSCLSEVFTRFLFGNTFNSQSFALLFDFSDRRGGNIVGSTSTCEVGEVYDPFFKKCRNVICGRKNQEYRFGHCIDLISDEIPLSTETTTASKQTTLATTTNEPTPDPISSSTTTTVSPSEFSTFPNSSLFLTTPNVSIILTTPVPETTSTSVFFSENSTTDVVIKNTSITTDSSSGTTLKPPTPSTEPSDVDIKVNKVISKTDNSSVLDSDSKNANNVTTPDTDSINNTSTVISHEESIANSSSNTKQKPAQAKPCERFLLPKEEYTVNSNGTVLVEKYHRTYQISEYEPSDGGILVCIIQNDTEKFSKIMGWITLGGLGLSCICLLLHLLAFIFVPELRNLSGKNLASFCLVLLGAFSCFILSIFGEPAKLECFILAALMYYFFLASFCWVNVMAFDIWRTLSLATSELRVTSGKQCCKYMLYSIYGWILPVASVLGVVLLDKVQPEFMPPQYLPAFGEYWCWFGHRKALLVFFAAPLMGIMVLNITLFIMSARIIANTMESTAKMTSCAPYQSQFKLYMRLALLMGLTWISGIVAGYLQVEAIWYIFVLLNTLQGFFIFVAFTCTRKVWQSLRSICCCRRISGRSYTWTGRSPSSSKQGLQSTSSNISQLSNQSNSSPTAQLTSASQINAI